MKVKNGKWLFVIHHALQVMRYMTIGLVNTVSHTRLSSPVCKEFYITAYKRIYQDTESQSFASIAYCWRPPFSERYCPRSLP